MPPRRTRLGRLHRGRRRCKVGVPQNNHVKERDRIPCLRLIRTCHDPLVAHMGKEGCGMVGIQHAKRLGWVKLEIARDPRHHSNRLMRAKRDRSMVRPNGLQNGGKATTRGGYVSQVQRSEPLLSAKVVGKENVERQRARRHKKAEGSVEGSEPCGRKIRTPGPRRCSSLACYALRN